MATYKIVRERTLFDEFTVIANTPEEAEEFADEIYFDGFYQSEATQVVDLISEENDPNADYNVDD